MQQRKLGQLSTPVSAIGYGAMSFTDFYGPATEEGSEAILAQCINLGITHIDTSNAYGLGKSENRIGAFLAKQGKQAQDFFKIATKAGITRDADGKRKFDNSPEHLRASLDASLERLGVEQVELFYVQFTVRLLKTHYLKMVMLRTLSERSLQHSQKKHIQW